jgi:formylglycine-generating enzyme required for sulfatase activity
METEPKPAENPEPSEPRAEPPPAGENADTANAQSTERKSVSDVIREQEVAKPKIVFENHPALQRRKKRSESFSGSRQSKQNPIIAILEQHQTHRIRVAKISVSIFVLFLIAGFLWMAVNKWMDENVRARKLRDIERRIDDLEHQFTTKTGYEKSRKALEAAEWTDVAIRLLATEPSLWRPWQERKLRHIEAIRTQAPETMSDFVNPDILADMANIPKGRFNIGRKEAELGDDYERPWHPVVIDAEFWMSRTEITVSQYRTLFPRYRCAPWNQYRLDNPRQPVVRISWYEAMEFCKRLDEMAAASRRTIPGYQYRLPTEAEWEYASRAGTDTLYYWGDSFGQTGAKFANSLDDVSAKLFGLREGDDMAKNDGHRVSAPVGSFEPNAFGLHDMAGNVWEWCYDWYNPRAYLEHIHTSPVQIQPVMVKLRKVKEFDSGIYFVDATCRVIRGGSWGNIPFDLRASNRDYATPETSDTGIGFRVVYGPKIRTDAEKNPGK